MKSKRSGMRNYPGQRFGLTCDDLLVADTRKQSGAYVVWSRSRRKPRKAMVHADVITVSTPELANQVKIEYGRESIVVPNAWNDYALPIQEPAPIIEGEKIRIVYRGSNSHDGDLFAHRDAFREYPNIEFIFMGCMPWYFYTNYGGHMTTIIQEAWTNDIFGYFQRLIQLKPHFVVFPLEDNTFNRCKSNIAAIEATVAGAVGVFTQNICQNFENFQMPIAFKLHEENGHCFQL
jgi:hypothetical protein